MDVLLLRSVAPLRYLFYTDTVHDDGGRNATRVVDVKRSGGLQFGPEAVAVQRQGHLELVVAKAVVCDLRRGNVGGVCR